MYLENTPFYDSSEVLMVVNMKIIVFRDVMLCSLVESSNNLREICCFHLCSSTLKTLPAGSSGILVYLCHTIQHHIPENGNLHPSFYYQTLIFTYFPCCIKKDYYHLYMSVFTNSIVYLTLLKIL
jgi:hypothetical protein